MADYTRVYKTFWRGDRRKWTDAERVLALYLLSCEHSNLEGFYFLPKGYVAADLDWKPAKVDTTLQAVQAYGFAIYDRKAEVVLLPNALAHQQPQTEKQIRGSKAELAQVPPTPLWDAFLDCARMHAPKLFECIPQSHSNGNGKPIGMEIAAALKRELAAHA